MCSNLKCVLKNWRIIGNLASESFLINVECWAISQEKMRDEMAERK